MFKKTISLTIELPITFGVEKGCPATFENSEYPETIIDHNFTQGEAVGIIFDGIQADIERIDVELLEYVDKLMEEAKYEHETGGL